MAERLIAKAPKTAKKKENFAFFAPEALQVALAGTFTQWDKEPIKMRKLKDGTWKASVSLAPGLYEYRFLVDGKWQNDAHCPERIPNAFGEENCVRRVQ